MYSYRHAGVHVSMYVNNDDSKNRNGLTLCLY